MGDEMTDKLWCQMCGHEQSDAEARYSEIFDICGACGGRIVRNPKPEDAKPKWISVEDRLPNRGINVLIWDAGGDTIYTADHIQNIPQWSTEDGVYFHGSGYDRITHWMPLPEAPEGLTK